MRLGQPTTQTHCCCLYLAKQNTSERKRDAHRQGTKRRARRDFSLVGDGRDGLLIYARGVYLGDYRGRGGSVCALLEVQFVHVCSLNKPFCFLRNVLAALRDGGAQAQRPAMLMFF